VPARTVRAPYTDCLSRVVQHVWLPPRALGHHRAPLRRRQDARGDRRRRHHRPLLPRALQLRSLGGAVVPAVPHVDGKDM